MFAFLFIQLFLVILSLSNGEEIITIKRGEIYTKLQTPDHPNTFELKEPLIWKFKSENDDTKLRIQCEDFRTIESEKCSLVSVEFDDGVEKKEFCGTQEMLKITSSTNTFTVTLKGEEDYAQAAFSCSVKSIEGPEPELIDLTINKLQHFEGPNETAPFYDKVWQLKAAEGHQISLKCYINLIEEPCFEEILTMDLGDGEQELCGFEEKQYFTTGNEAKLRLELGSDGEGLFHCIAEAVVKDLQQPGGGDDETVARTLTDNEDSSEHGGPAGKKSTTCKCGWANKQKARIISGREATPNEYPWMVAVRAHFGKGYINCGGSIVTQRHVLTAAHCLLNMYVDMSSVAPEELFVYVGAHNLDKLETPTNSLRKYGAEKHFIRPEFIKAYTHDFAIIVVKENIEFSQNVGPICLSPKRIGEVNQKITILGWGVTNTGKPSSLLMKAKTAVMERKKCDINPWEICTRSKPSSTCTGDSGGPLSWLDPETNRYTLMSLVSFGDPDCVSSPSVSTDISFFYNWIQEIIKSTYPQVETCTKQ